MTTEGTIDFVEIGNLLTDFDKAPLAMRARLKVVEGGSNHGAVVLGGDPLVQGPPHPNLLRGRDRHFGAKVARPGLAFEEAVEAAVSQRLATSAE